MSVMAHECLKKTYVKFRYIPPHRPLLPADCKQVNFEKGPDIRIFTGQISRLEGRPADEIIGIDLLCAVPSTARAGAIILLLQASTYVEWMIGFKDQQGAYVLEMHRVFVSIPMMYKLQGPRIALNAISPWYLKLANYGGQIAVGFKKLNEIEKVMARILKLKKGFCPEEIKAMVDGLKAFETELNLLLERAARETLGEHEIARRMDANGHQQARFAGARLA
jgi:hypothetical protein